MEDESTTQEVDSVVESTEEPESLSTETEGTEQSSDDAARVALELDSAQKFKWKGKEYSLKDLEQWQSGHMRQQDYSRKTQEVAKERKYYDNLQYDLDRVKADPTLANQFKSVYPEKFHKFLSYVEKKEIANAVNDGQVQKQPGESNEQLLERLNRLESDYHERKVKAFESELDAKFKVLSEKYPMADEEAVLARASALIDKGEELSDQSWDSLWKSTHEKTKALLDKHYSKQVNQQKQANLKGKEAASGGSIAGSAPKGPRTIKEASEFAIREM